MKCATVPKPKLFHQLNTPIVYLQQLEHGVAKAHGSWMWFFGLVTGCDSQNLLWGLVKFYLSLTVHLICCNMRCSVLFANRFRVGNGVPYRASGNISILGEPTRSAAGATFGSSTSVYAAPEGWCWASALRSNTHWSKRSDYNQVHEVETRNRSSNK